MTNGNLEMDRPIILSPPPLEQSISVGHAERQPSLGFNLQHEFETLTADLDLDLKHRQSVGQSSSNVPSSNELFMPQATGYGFDEVSSAKLLHETNSSSGSNFLKGPNQFSPGNNMPERPQSVNDFSNFFSHQPLAPQSLDQGPNFYLELIKYTNWINSLNNQEISTFVDYMANNVSFDVLLSLRSKTENKLQMMQGGLQSSIHLGQTIPPPVHSVPPGMYGGPSSSFNHPTDLVHEMEQVSLNSSSMDHIDSNNFALHQPKPKSNTLRGGQLFEGNVRAKSAEPSINGKPPMMSMSNPLDRTKSPTSHLYEKTNFLQLAAGNPTSPGIHPQGGQTRSNNSDDSLDLSQAALKLGALATINSRVALDSNKKNFLPSSYNRHHYMDNDQYRQQNKMTKSPPNSKNKKSSTPPDSNRNYGGHSSDLGHNSLLMPQDIANPELLENIPAWLKLLRLHKYTDCLKDIPWRELIEYDDAQLESKGVKALGARTKLLKTFDAVKKRT